MKRTLVRRQSFDADNTACLVRLAVPPYELNTTFFAIPKCDLLTSEDLDVLGAVTTL
jgi:hypothetical protein